MTNYDFNNAFSPAEFQDFARDMIQIREGILIESFAEGRDLGIDGRHVRADGYTIIIQAKRLLDTGGRILSIARKEKEKIDKLVKQGMRIDRYILALSGNTSFEKKEAIRKFFSPYIIAPEDIITSNDFNNYLSSSTTKYKQVEEKYFKLWIQNIYTLKRTLYEVVHSPLVQQSEIHLNEAIEKVGLFVETEIYREAINKVQKNRVLIISGEPGVGKTTLASQVALYYYAKYQFRAFIYATSVEDLYTAQRIEGKKVIFFDDFWGSNGFDALGNGLRVKDLVDFIEYIRKRKDCLLIMTTREYVLEQGLKNNEDFRRLVESNKLDCRIEQYSEADKLRIYYGHLREVSLTWEQVNLLRDAGISIIASKNYNPRVIELFTKSITPNMDPRLCVEDFKRYINCPIDFWKKIFNELSQEARVVYLLMAIMPLPTEMKLLEECYCEALKANGKSLEWKGFSEIIFELEKTVIRTDLYNQSHFGIMAVTFQNPSAKDFITALLREKLENYSGILLQASRYYSQCVEYLKILNEIPDDRGLYEKVMEKTIGLIDSASILFYEKYRQVLSANKETDKYHLTYNTDQNCSEYGFGRYFQVMLLYRRNRCLDLKEWFESTFISIVKKIERYPEAVLYEDLQTFPQVALRMVREGICKDIKRMMNVYMDSLMRNREELGGGYFAIHCKSQWNAYKCDNREKIGLYLKRYYQAELCLAAVEKDEEEFEYLLDKCDEDFENYGLEVPEDLQTKRKLYEQWLYMNNDDETGGEEENVWGWTRNIDEVKREFKEGFLEEILPVGVMDLQTWLEMNRVPADIQSVLEETMGSFNDFWDCFLNDEESLEFLVEFVSFTGCLEDNIFEASKDIVRYMDMKCGLGKEELYGFLDCLSASENEKCIWSAAELEESCPEIYLWREEAVEKMVQARILVHRHHWYRPSNWMLLFSAYIERLYEMPGAERESYYRTLFEQDEDISGLSDSWDLIHSGRLWLSREDTEQLTLAAMCQLEPELFKRYKLFPLAARLYDTLHSATKEAEIEKLIDEMDMMFDVGKDGLQSGGIASMNEYFFVLESIGDFSIFDALPEAFSEDQMQILGDNGFLEQNGTNIEVKQLMEKGLLKSLGIYERLEIIWGDICKWRTEGENNGWC